ncbi:MAG: cell division ATP-binding protein FtsE [Gammaproteobacteria bacterium]
MFHFSAVTKTYPGGNQGLRNIDFLIEAGEYTFLTGHSGAGKSTLLRLIALIERTSRGNVIVDGRNLERVSAHEVPYYRRHIGMIFQEHKLLPRRSVFENVALPLTVAAIRPREIRKRVRAALDKVNLLPKERATPDTLSAGEQQRVGIARAVVNRPTILLADEPTGNLDPGLSQEILALFDQFNQVGVTVMIATHDAQLLRKGHRRVIELKEGSLLSDTLPAP